MKKVFVEELIDALGLEVIYMGADKKGYICVSEINRPGLEMAGYFKHFTYDRIQIIGKGEYCYFDSLDENTKKERLEKLFSYDIPAFIYTRGFLPDQYVIDMAKKHNQILLATKSTSTRFINKICNYLEEKLAPTIVQHGVLVDLFGIGVYITGESGVGKSETALELVKRGHRLVADDAVEISKIGEEYLVGRAPEMIKYLMEIRGIGILDIKSLYGVGAVKQNKVINLVIQLENWKDNKYYDRLGLEEEFDNILGIDVTKLTIPVKPGRNIAMIIEVAARNHRQKTMGYNTAKEFNEKLMRTLENNNE